MKKAMILMAACLVAGAAVAQDSPVDDWGANWFFSLKGGASAFVGTPVGHGDLFDREKYQAKDILTRRINILKSQKQSQDGISLETFKDWMSGVMRKYLFLDDTAHGSSGYIDPRDPKWDWESDGVKRKWVVGGEDEYENHGLWLRDRFSDKVTGNDHDPLRRLKPLMKVLWSDYFDDKKLSLKCLSEDDADEKIQRL